MTPAEIGLFGTVAGGSSAIALGLIQLVNRVIEKKNGRHPCVYNLPPEDRRALFDAQRGIAAALEAIIQFKTSHEKIHDLLRAQTTALTLLTERLSDHFGDFRCMARDVEAVKRGEGK